MAQQDKKMQEGICNEPENRIFLKKVLEFLQKCKCKGMHRKINGNYVSIEYKGVPNDTR